MDIYTHQALKSILILNCFNLYRIVIPTKETTTQRGSAVGRDSHVSTLHNTGTTSLSKKCIVFSIRSHWQPCPTILGSFLLRCSFVSYGRLWAMNAQSCHGLLVT